MSEWENLKKEWDKEDKKEKGFGEEWVETITDCLPRCPRCQGALQTVNVGGHEQCVLCHSVIDDCCQGAPL